MEDKTMTLVSILLFVLAGIFIFGLAPIFISRRGLGRAVCPRCQRPADCFFDPQHGIYRLSCACGHQEKVTSLDDHCPFCHRKHRH